MMSCNLETMWWLGRILAARPASVYRWGLGVGAGGAGSRRRCMGRGVGLFYYHIIVNFCLRIIHNMFYFKDCCAKEGAKMRIKWFMFTHTHTHTLDQTRPDQCRREKCCAPNKGGRNPRARCEVRWKRWRRRKGAHTWWEVGRDVTWRGRVGERACVRVCSSGAAAVCQVTAGNLCALHLRTLPPQTAAHSPDFSFL